MKLSCGIPTFVMIRGVLFATNTTLNLLPIVGHIHIFVESYRRPIRLFVHLRCVSVPKSLVKLLVKVTRHMGFISDAL